MLNKAILMGRLTADPELRHTPNNVPVLSFTIAVDRAYSKDGKRETDFLDIVAWRSTAEFISKYFHKGQLIAVSGSIQARLWEDKEGRRRRNIEIIADEVHFADNKKPTYNNSGDSYFIQPNDTEESAPSFSEPSDFEQVSDDDGELPF